jgi:hypothetical protein
MALATRLDYGAPSSASSPDGTSTFPFNTVVIQAPTIPAGATAIFGNSAVVSAAIATATLAATSSRLNYITGFTVTGLGATAATMAAITVSGLAGGTQTFAAYPVPAGVGVSGPIMAVNLPNPIPASAVNTAINVNVASFGSGNVGAQSSVQGYMI